MIMRRQLFALLAAATFVGLESWSSADKKPAIKKEKLQIIFLFGQSYMVGLADARTAWYLTQPPYVPPREVAGLVWFQGYSDKDNPAYGELLAQLIRDFRKKVKTPELPVVCGSLGMTGFKHTAFQEHANKGMLQAAKMPDLAGTVDVVNTAPFYPHEFDLLKQVMQEKEEGSPEYKKAATAARGKSNVGFHYHGSAKCFLLMGDAMGRSLAKLMAGGTPTPHAEPPR